ncbi:MAG: CRISPR-associated protein Csx3 [Desulfoplanes sp.]|nr:CRISPR-associated protein Csx3 [Desulfoplanes sp.]MDD4650378.1 CRISPR-associated protein Csx3 [Desulfoplanes sp.]
MSENTITIDVSTFYAEQGQAKLSLLKDYEDACLGLAGKGTEVVLTGPGPVWLYLRLAHTLHGKARSLFYDSPVTGKVEIFNHNPF